MLLGRAPDGETLQLPTQKANPAAQSCFCFFLLRTDFFLCPRMVSGKLAFIGKKTQ